MTAKLYPGIAFSPVAELTDNVGAGDTIIPVSDVEAFPPAPNLATIGTDEKGETILYAAKTATALSGCTRGVEGTARAWSAGEPIARNWTAKDHASLIAAVEGADTAAQTANKVAQEAKDGAEPKGTADAVVSAHNSDSTAHGELFAAKQPKLTGQPGQVVGFDGMGRACAVPGWSNPNLLDNWYFVDPVNQRGQTEYASTGYTIDRWYIWSIGKMGTVKIGNGITLTGEEGTSIIFDQRLDEALELYGKVVTISILVGFVVGKFELQITDSFYKEFSEPGLISITGVINNVGNDGPKFRVFNNQPNSSCIIKAAKLELGPVQTLAHQDADGNWILNDPPPNKALELAKCQRYFVRVPYAALETIGTTTSTPSWINLQLSGPSMRITSPAISISSELVRTLDGLTLPAPSSCSARNGNINIGFAHSGTANAASYIYGKTAGYIDLDANL